MNRVRRRLLSAIALGLAGAGCPAQSTNPSGAASTEKPLPPPPPQPVEPVPAASLAPTPPPAPTTTGKLASLCDKPEPYCIAPNTGPQGHQIPIDPKTLKFDENGCLPHDQHSVSCAGRQALDGPRFEKGQCCYTVCQGPVPPCGRPLRVAGAAIVAPLTRAHRWSDAIPTLGAELDPRTRRALADAWLQDARYEHASIASFSRFALELMAVGAPPDLIADAHHAALDEVRHAQACFAIASAYGDPRGPGALPLSGVTPRAELADIAAAAVRDGCIGETYAAMVAQRAADACREPHVEKVLRAIAEEELRHAELAWRFVAWAAARGARAAIVEAFAFAPDIPTAPPHDDPSAWRDGGRFSHAELTDIWQETRAHVVGPCAAVLRDAPHA